MKKVTLLITLMITSLGFSQTYLPLTFTNANQLMTGSDLSVATLVPDPLDGANQVMQIVGDAAQQWDQASLVLSTSVNLSDDANNTITFRINPIGITGTRTHLLKFEGNGQTEFWFDTTDSGWQTITANFPAGLVNYPKILIFTDGGSSNTGTYLVDDIMGATNLPLSGGVTLPFTFSDPNELMTGSDASVATLVSDPLDGTNQVMQIVGDVAQQWDQASINLNPSVNLSDDANNTITFRINPIGITGTRSHIFKFEGNGAVEYWFDTTDSGWQTITANFGAGLVAYPKMLIFTDAGTSNTGTYLVDDIKFTTALSTAKFDKASIKMYPNPVKNTLTIEANSTIQRVSVFNVLGQEVMTASPKSNSAILQTSELRKGVYMITTDIDGVISTSKVLKE